MAKITDGKVAKNSKIGDFLEADLPKSEGQIRPLTALENDSERIHVWNKSARWAELQDVHQLIDSSSFMAKLIEKKFTKNGKFVNFSETVLPNSEWQIRPLLALENDSKKIHVWNKGVEGV